MFGLKAELFKKQKEVNSKAPSNSVLYPEVIRKQHKVKAPSDRDIKHAHNYVKNPGVEARSERDETKSDAEENKEKMAHSILEAKSKLYDKLTSGEVIPDEESCSEFLVDFEQKSIEAWRDKRNKTDSAVKPEIGLNIASEVKKALESVHKERGNSMIDTASTAQQGDVTTRGSNLAVNDIKKKKNNLDIANKTLLSDDMRREAEREEWEKEAMEDINGPVHYANLKDEETRELGVGYYSFSTDSESRDSQMKMLLKMREETEKERKNFKTVEQRKRTALQARLEKVRERRIKKLKAQGKEIPEKLLVPISLDDENKKENDATSTEGESTDAHSEKVVSQTRISLPQLREWDAGKAWMPAVPDAPPKNWKDPREERLDEFAPPSFYYKDVKRRKETARSYHDFSDNKTDQYVSFPSASETVPSVETSSPPPVSSSIKEEVESRSSSVSSDIKERSERVLEHVRMDLCSQQVNVIDLDTGNHEFNPDVSKPIVMKVKSLPKKNNTFTRDSAFEDP